MNLRFGENILMKNIGVLIFLTLQFSCFNSYSNNKDTVKDVKTIIIVNKEYSFGAIQDIKENIFLKKIAKSFAKQLRLEGIVTDSIKVAQNIYSRKYSQAKAHEIMIHYHFLNNPMDSRTAALYINNLEGITYKIRLIANRYYLLDRGSFIGASDFKNTEGSVPEGFLSSQTDPFLHISLDSTYLERVERRSFIREYLLSLSEVRRQMSDNQEYLLNNNYTSKAVYYLPDTMGSGRVRLTNSIVTLIYNNDSAKVKDDFNKKLEGLDSLIHFVSLELEEANKYDPLQFATTSSTQLYDILSKEKDIDKFDVVYSKKYINKQKISYLSFKIISDSSDVTMDYKAFFKSIYLNFYTPKKKKRFLGII